MKCFMLKIVEGYTTRTNRFQYNNYFFTALWIDNLGVLRVYKYDFESNSMSTGKTSVSNFSCQVLFPTSSWYLLLLPFIGWRYAKRTVLFWWFTRSTFPRRIRGFDRVESSSTKPTMSPLSGTMSSESEVELLSASSTFPAMEAVNFTPFTTLSWHVLLS